MTRAAVFGSVLLIACGITDAQPPDPDKYINVSVIAGGEQVGMPGSALEDTIVVRLKSTVSLGAQPISGRQISFKAPAESGIVFSPSTVVSDATGTARAVAQLGNGLGRYTIEVNFIGSPALPTTFVLESALAPIVSQVTPGTTTADGMIVITGQSFSPKPELNEVTIDGSRAEITNATNTRLDVRVPSCMPTRPAQVIVRRGSLASTAMQINVTATSGAALNLAVGAFSTASDLSGLSCVRLAAQSTQAEYLVITQQTATTGTAQVPLRLLGLRSGTIATEPASAYFGEAAPRMDAETRFAVLMHERASALLGAAHGARPQPNLSMTAAVPKVGDRREFRVFVPNQPAPSITAVARGVSQQMVVFEDTAAAGSVPQEDIDKLLASLDDPIYTTDVAVFGVPSDLDHNQRIIMLLTPAVNRLTRADETSFITGFFDPCDLLSLADCPDSNVAEILYGVVPDPTGKWGLKHSVTRIVQLLPPLAAHEFAHLIHFNQRILITQSRTPEDLWLMEALAHFAEDTVAEVLRGRGLTADADLFGKENFIRAAMFLAATQKTSLVASTGEANLEERGAAWLFLKYLNNRVGGNFIRRIETTTLAGADNVVAVAGASWSQLMRDWSVALYATGSGLTVPQTQTFGAFDLRAAMVRSGILTYPLKPADSGNGDFLLDWSMRPSSTSFVRVVAPAGGSVNLTVAGDRGGSFSTAAKPQVIVFRIK